MARKSQKANVENEAPVVSTPKASKSDTVFVALNRPQGIKFLIDNGKTSVEIKGNAENLRGQSKGVLPIGGFGLTEIPRGQWEQIEKLYGKMEIFKNGLIFVSNRKADAQDEAEEKAELRNGLEPVDVGKSKTQSYDGMAD